MQRDRSSRGGRGRPRSAVGAGRGLGAGGHRRSRRRPLSPSDKKEMEAQARRPNLACGPHHGSAPLSSAGGGTVSARTTFGDLCRDGASCGPGLFLTVPQVFPALRSHNKKQTKEESSSASYLAVRTPAHLGPCPQCRTRVPLGLPGVSGAGLVSSCENGLQAGSREALRGAESAPGGRPRVLPLGQVAQASSLMAHRVGTLET